MLSSWFSIQLEDARNRPELRIPLTTFFRCAFWCLEINLNVFAPTKLMVCRTWAVLVVTAMVLWCSRVWSLWSRVPCWTVYSYRWSSVRFSALCGSTGAGIWSTIFRAPVQTAGRSTASTRLRQSHQQSRSSCRGRQLVLLDSAPPRSYRSGVVAAAESHRHCRRHVHHCGAQREMGSWPVCPSVPAPIAEDFALFHKSDDYRCYSFVHIVGG